MGEKEMVSVVCCSKGLDECDFRQDDVYKDEEDSVKCGRLWVMCSKGCSIRVLDRDGEEIIVSDDCSFGERILI